MNKVAFIFPGQGAQYVGMARDFYDTFPIVQETFQAASNLLGFDYTKLILEGPEELLRQTEHAQVAIFVVSAAVLRVVQEKLPELEPTVCAGLSLGEYTALFAAGYLSFEAALTLVAARGKLMQQACIDSPGTMRVVLGLAPSQMRLPPGVTIANLNCPGQVVIAGDLVAIQQADEMLKQQGAKRVLPLEVSGAFHSPLMKSAQDGLKPTIDATLFESVSTPVVMNVPGAFVTDIREVRRYLFDQVASPTYWEKGVRAMDDAGVDLYIEMGPGKTLAGMNRKMGVKGETMSIEKVTDLAGLEALYASAAR